MCRRICVGIPGAPYLFPTHRNLGFSPWKPRGFIPRGGRAKAPSAHAVAEENAFPGFSQKRLKRKYLCDTTTQYENNPASQTPALLRATCRVAGNHARLQRRVYLDSRVRL